jgi:hypothetical protein
MPVGGGTGNLEAYRRRPACACGLHQEPAPDSRRPAAAETCREEAMKPDYGCCHPWLRRVLPVTPNGRD